MLNCDLFSNNHSADSITSLSDCTLVKKTLFGEQHFTKVENSYIINATIKYLVDHSHKNGKIMNMGYYDRSYDYGQVQWPTSLAIYDLNDLNVFMIIAFPLINAGPH